MEGREKKSITKSISIKIQQKEKMNIKSCKLCSENNMKYNKQKKKETLTDYINESDS